MSSSFKLSLQHALGRPSTKLPINITTFVSYVVPPLACYILAAALVVTAQTRAFRIALWPVVTLLAFRAAVSVDLSQGNPERKFFNIEYVRVMICMVIHTLSWALAKKPFVRHLRPANSSPSTIMDALDLVTNLRGHGWNWSRGLYVPRDPRPTNRIAFAFCALLSLVAHIWISGIIHLAIQTFTTGTGPGSQAITIFDGTLPFFARYLRGIIITILGAILANTGPQMSYDLLTILGVLLFRQDPAQWPPACNNPWFATSLGDFWGRRWHQWFRQTFLTCSYPLTLVLGRSGTLIGAFLASGYLHYILMTTLDSRAEMWKMVVPFGMMAPGIIAERAFYWLTRRKVGGVVGWVWTMGWLVLWGTLIVDEFVRVGMYASSSAVDSQLPLHGLVEKSVMDFEAWLHTM